MDVQVDLLAGRMTRGSTANSGAAPRLLGVRIPAGIVERRRRVLVLAEETGLQGDELAQNGDGIHHDENLEQEQGLHSNGHQEGNHGREYAKLEDDGYQGHLKATDLAKGTALCK